MSHDIDDLYRQQQIEDEWRDQSPDANQMIFPVTAAERTKNPLRPHTLADVIGQADAVNLMATVIDRAIARGRWLDHVLLVGPSGTGKSTFSHVIANELGVDVYEVEAPISHDTLLELRETMQDGDVLRIEEVHQQAIMDRRGKQSATQPEVLYAVMEDRTITTGAGVFPFPEITVIGTTTDEGMLPDPFLNRFPLRPVLESYTEAEMKAIALMNADKLGLMITAEAAQRFANASRKVPRQLNNLVKNAASLADDVDEDLAKVVIHMMNGLTEDGLTRDMQNMLRFLLTRTKRTNMQGEVTYQASVNTIATAIGKSRDSKAITLRVEPYLIEKGYVQVGHGGRKLTDDGIERAKELLK